MPTSSGAPGSSGDPAPEAGEGPAADRDQRHRERARAHAATLAETAARVAVELPISADVDDFRRVLAAEGKP